MKKEMTHNFTVKELLNHTFYRAFINTRLRLCVNYSVSTASNISLKQVDSAKDNNLKEEGGARKCALQFFLSPSLSLTINLLTHDYVSHTFVFPLVETCTST